MSDILKWEHPWLLVRGHRFKAMTFTGARPKNKWLVIWKDRPLVEALAAVLSEVNPQRVFELGIALGGSTAFISAYSNPDKLLAIDYSSEPVEALAAFIERNGLHDRVTPMYGVDQADKVRLRSLADEAFGKQAIDLVIDDASHRLHESRQSFEALFPRVRPGGVYLIEDWQWGLRPLSAEARAQDPDSFAFWPTGQPLMLLGMELMLALANAGGGQDTAIQSVSIDQHFIKVVRGTQALADDFTLESLYPEEARELLGKHAILDEPTESQRF